MLNYEIKNKLNELKEKNCKSVWFILKNSNHRGAEFKDIINNTEKECIELVYAETVETLKYSDIIHIRYTY